MAPRWYINLAVIVSGGSVLAVEILGTRLIGPFYGGSLYLWSALIGITLGALSLGYALGGRWADRGPRGIPDGDENPAFPPREALRGAPNSGRDRGVAGEGGDGLTIGLSH